jgi:hypothetical protein
VAQADPNSYAYSGATWLSDQLDSDGLVHGSYFDGTHDVEYTDYGLSLDIFYALDKLDTRPAAAAAIIDGLAADPAAYTDAFGPSAGASGKLTTAVETAGRDATSFGGTDLVQQTEDRVHTGADAENGRAVANADDYPSTINQGWVVRALSAAGSDLADETTDFLLKQQCAAGFFRESQETLGASSTFTCDAAADKTPSIDATALAVQALEAAEQNGDPDARAAIDKAVTWLLTQQRADGSFVGQDVSNSNTTGLVAWVLADEGRSGAAGNAAAWLQKLQVTDAVGEGTALSNDLGAVAYDSDGLAAGKQDGITKDTRDQWRRATAQSVVALDAALPAKTLSAAAPTGYQHGGSTVTLRASGLAPGEHFRIALGSVRSATGTAGAAGTGAARILLPRSTRTYAVVVTGSRSVRTGSSTISVLGPRKFSATVKSRPIRRARTQHVTVSGLAPGEKARLFYRGARIWSGSANAAGRVVRSFGSGRSLGPKKLVLRGAFSDRSVTTTFRVVR